ncbi:hypothetical protein [Okeania sp. KiyG1]|nr:hypothetical protein [Okeania sp. KiyG1]
MTLQRKRTLCFGMIDNQFNYCSIVMTFHRKRSLCLGMINV